MESFKVAIAFHRMFDFEHVVNGYIPGRNYMPVGYGQLGCSGFVISDKDGYFVSKKTKRFLDYGDEAFEHVEGILKGLIPAEVTVTTESDASGAKDDATTAASETASGSDSAASEPRSDTIGPPASVGVQSMDDEHQECTDAFNKVLQDQSSCSLQKLYNILKSHFEHEESLMAKFSDASTSDQNSTFSSLTSHKLDHERIVAIAKKELDRVTAGEVLRGK